MGKTLDGPSVGQVVHRTEPADTHMSRCGWVFQPNSGNIEWHGVEAHALLEFRYMLGIRGKERGDAGRQGPVAPAGRLALPVQARFQMIDGDRMKVGMADIILAGPLQFDRLPSNSFATKAASITKSGFDLRPKPPPSSV